MTYEDFIYKCDDFFEGVGIINYQPVWYAKVLGCKKIVYIDLDSMEIWEFTQNDKHIYVNKFEKTEAYRLDNEWKIDKNKESMI